VKGPAAAADCTAVAEVIWGNPPLGLPLQAALVDLVERRVHSRASRVTFAAEGCSLLSRNVQPSELDRPLWML
jgi:hypothetical protein